MTSAGWLWPRIIIVSAVAVCIVHFLDIVVPVRSVVAFWFLLTCPGMAYVRLIKIEDGFTELTLGIALSVAINTIVSLVMVYSQAWSPDFALLLLIGLTVLGAVLQIFQEGRRKRVTPQLDPG